MKSVSIPAKLQRLGGRVNAFMDRSRRRFYTYLAFLTTTAAVTAPTFCAPDKMQTIFNKMLDIIFKIALYLGAGITAFALVSWILAMKDENAEGQSRAIRYAVVGVALIGFKLLVKPIFDSIF